MGVADKSPLKSKSRICRNSGWCCGDKRQTETKVLFRRTSVIDRGNGPTVELRIPAPELYRPQSECLTSFFLFNAPQASVSPSVRWEGENSICFTSSFWRLNQIRRIVEPRAWHIVRAPAFGIVVLSLCRAVSPNLGDWLCFLLSSGTSDIWGRG